MHMECISYGAVYKWSRLCISLRGAEFLLRR